jgi:hypothetical protein
MLMQTLLELATRLDTRWQRSWFGTLMGRRTSLLLQLWARRLLDHQGSNGFPESCAGGRIEGVGTEEIGECVGA